MSCAGCCQTLDTGGDFCGSSHKLTLLGLGALWQSRVLDSEVPFQRLRPDLWLGNQDSTSCLLWHERGLKQKTKQETKENPPDNWEIQNQTNKSEDKGTYTYTHIKLKQPKEKEVEESNPVTKGNKKWHRPVTNKTKTQTKKQDQSRVPTGE